MIVRTRFRFASLLGFLAAWGAISSCSDDAGTSGSANGGAAGATVSGGGSVAAGAPSGGTPSSAQGGSTIAGGDGGVAGVTSPTSGGEGGSGASGGAAEAPIKPVTALVVLEGLRPDLVSQATTPFLWSLGKRGVRFTSHRASVPSNRMASAATLATGTLPATHGVLGSRLYLPGANATDASGRAVDFSQPVDIEDRGILESLQAKLEGGFLRARTFVEVATRYGLRTAVLGRVGPASLFDLGRLGWSLDDHYAWPRSFADWLNHSAETDRGTLPLKIDRLFPDLVPIDSPFLPQLESQLLASPGIVWDNWAGSALKFVPDNINSVIDGTRARRHSAYDNAEASEKAALEHLLETARLDVLVLWLREPAESLSRYGAGSVATLDALLRADRRFNDFVSLLPDGSNVIVSSDGGGSTLAGDSRLLPRYALSQPVPGADASGWVPLDIPGGVPVDGAVRLAELLNRAGFHAYDGYSCLSGHAFTAYPSYVYDSSWPIVCKGEKGGEQTGPAIAPAELAADAIVTASNGGAELAYVPSHDRDTVTRVAQFLQQRPEFGAVFVSSRYSPVPGTFDAKELGFGEDAPDLLINYAWSSEDVVAGAPFVDVGRPPNTWTRLSEDCSTKVCRGGLYCPTTGEKKCRFCPSDRSETDALCGVAASELSAARAASVYLPAGELCESSSVCQAPLECSFGRCRAVETIPGPDRTSPAMPNLAGSSYGAMAGFSVDRDPTVSASPLKRFVRDVAGVRGGAAPADLSAVLIVAGPAFRSGLIVDTPSGLADVAPTLLHVVQPGLEAELGSAEGRLLIEGLADQAGKPSVTMEAFEATSKKRTFYSPGAAVSTEQSAIASGDYTATLRTTSVRQTNSTYRYVVSAGASRTGLACAKPSDCLSGVCGAKGVCGAPSCNDGVKNALEAAIDCGGPNCKACPEAACGAAQDCASGKCADGKCAAATCSDSLKNGDETAIDCGGSCSPCVAGKVCRADADCASKVCGIEMVARVCR